MIKLILKENDCEIIFLHTSLVSRVAKEPTAIKKYENILVLSIIGIIGKGPFIFYGVRGVWWV